MASEEATHQIRSKEGAGHLFIVQGDLTELICDAWLLPTDSQRKVEAHWLEALADHFGDLEVSQSIAETNLTSSGSRPLEGLPREGRCVPWLTDVAHYEGARENRACAGVREFINGAYQEVGARDSRLCLAIPVVGTGKGGWDEKVGDLLLELVQTVLEQISDPGYPDVVLVVHDDEQTFAAAQIVRERALEDGDLEGWPSLSDDLRVVARELAEKALGRELVVFIGAGLSQSAGLPGWSELLEELAKEVGLEINEEFRKLSPLDRAWLIERTLELAKGAQSAEEELTLGDLVGKRLPDDRPPALSHQLIGSLPVREFVTTNYDRLFEKASKYAGNEARSLANEAPESDSRWLLKLHGSTDRPEKIVLSRNDYLNYASDRAALAGIVQAMLMTRHMLFVGFSLSDDNFIKIAHSVRNAIGDRPPDSKPVGTALMFDPPDSISRLWGDFIDIQTIDNESSDGRALEVFLDLVLARATTHRMSFLLDPTFGALLSNDDREVRDALTVAAQSISQDNQSEAASHFVQLMERMGSGKTRRMGNKS